MTKIVDFHLHTNNSDGGLDVNKLLELVKSSGANKISITDHDNIDVYKKISHEAASGLEIISGVELTGYFKGQKFHFTMYGFDLGDRHISSFFDILRREDIWCFKKMLRQLRREKNIRIDKNLLADFIRRNGYFNIVKVSNLLFEAKISPSQRDAFYMYTRGLEERRKIHSFAEISRLASRTNSKLFIAHPMRTIDDIDEIEGIIVELKRIGIDGIEVFTSRHTQEKQIGLLGLAKKHNLLVSGGSDYHEEFGGIETKQIGVCGSGKITLDMLSDFFTDQGGVIV